MYMILTTFSNFLALKVFESALSLGAGESAMLLNGIPVEMEVYDVYTLLDLMKSEARLMEGLFSLGFKASLLKSNSVLK